MFKFGVVENGYNTGHNILEFGNILVKVQYSISKALLVIYYKTNCVPVASQFVESLMAECLRELG